MDDRLVRLDHLRFAACFAVMSWHFTHAYVPVATTPAFAPLSIIEEGHTGVSLFCVISGFIFAWLYSQRDLQYLPFIRRRLFRIMPLFLLMMLLSFFVVETWSIKDFLKVFTTFHMGGLPGYVGPGWSVLIEFQFYYVFPFLLLFARRYGIAYLAGLLCLFIGIRALVWVDKGTVQALSYWTIFGRADQFLVGMAAGLICRNLAERSEQKAQGLALVLGALGLVLIAATYARFNAAGGFDFDPKSPFWIVLPTIEALCYGAIVSAYIFLPRNASQALGFVSKAFGYLGRITYSMYLVHLLIFLVVWKLIPMSATTWEQAMLWFILVGLPAVIVASSLTYAVVERPFLELERSDAVSLAVWRSLSGILVGTGLSNNLFRPQAERIRQRLAAAEAPAIAPAADGPDAGRG